MNRRVELETLEDNRQQITWYLNPTRYNALFLEGEFTPDQPLTMAGRDVEEVVDDVDEMDRYFEQLEQKRGMTGAEVFRAVDGDDDGWQ